MAFLQQPCRKGEPQERVGELHGNGNRRFWSHFWLNVFVDLPTFRHLPVTEETSGNDWAGSEQVQKATWSQTWSRLCPMYCITFCVLCHSVYIHFCPCVSLSVCPLSLLLPLPLSLLSTSSLSLPLSSHSPLYMPPFLPPALSLPFPCFSFPFLSR